MDSLKKKSKEIEESSKDIIKDKSKKKRSIGRYSKKKGNKYELDIVNELKAQGYDAVTSRNESKRMDDLKVDVISNFPYNIQAKCTQAKPNYSEIFKSYTLDKPLAIFHKTQVKKKVNCTSDGEFVILKKEDFYKLVNKDI